MNKTCQNCNKEFLIDQDDRDFYLRMSVPLPTFCPTCRMVRRFNFRNEGKLFRRTDAHNGKEIFSGFSPEAPLVTYENNYWFGDDWDPFETGMEYDFSVPFFEQLRKLLSVAPLPARSVFNMENSDYCNEASESKNCYLCFNTDYIENSAYLRKIRNCKDSFDCYEVENIERCYENILVDKSYQTFFSLDCDSCVDVWFSKGLRGCTNCFGCVNLRNKSYYFFNEPFTKEEYFEKIKQYTEGSYQALCEVKKRAADFWLTFPNKFYHGIKNINFSGDRIYNSKNVKDSYFVKGAENLRYCQDIWPNTNNCYDYSVWGDSAENIYECMTCGLGVANLKFCFNCWEGARDLEYCIYGIGAKNCFGCVGMRKQEYCVLNKQYSKEDYFMMVEKIKKHMDEMPYIDSKGRTYRYGEFFPFELSINAYNESLAQDFFPLTESSAKEKGYLWREPTFREYTKDYTADELPDAVNDTPEDITDKIIECSDCKKAYRIIESEFQFYKKMQIPLPRKCHNCRFEDRFQNVEAPVFWNRTCMCVSKDHDHLQAPCTTTFTTPYSLDTNHIIYCEKCYQLEVN